MKFKVKIGNFQKGILPVIDVAIKGILKDTPGVNKVKIEAKTDSIEATSFGGKMGIVSTLSNKTINELKLEVETEGSITVCAIDLANVLSSFVSTEYVYFEVKDNNNTKELCVYLETDKEEFQTLPCYDDVIDLPKKASKFENEITITRQAFLKGLKQVSYALGYESTKPRFLYWALKVSNEKARFSAGDGGRWAVLDMTGKNLVNTSYKKEVVYLFLKDHTPIIGKALEYATSDSLSVKQSAKNDGHHIVLSCEPFEIILVGMDPTVQPVDEDIFLDMTYENSVILSVAEIEYASKGILATFNDQCKQLNKEHKVKVAFDFEKDAVKLNANYSMSSSRKVKIIDKATKEKECWFIAVSPYIKEITNSGGEYVQVEMSGAKKPVLVRYYAGTKVGDKNSILTTDSATGISERFVTFFATYAN